MSGNIIAVAGGGALDTTAWAAALPGQLLRHPPRSPSQGTLNHFQRTFNHFQGTFNHFQGTLNNLFQGTFNRF
jgi:hypothetical protein